MRQKGIAHIVACYSVIATVVFSPVVTPIVAKPSVFPDIATKVFNLYIIIYQYIVEDQVVWGINRYAHIVFKYQIIVYYGVG